MFQSSVCHCYQRGWVFARFSQVLFLLLSLGASEKRCFNNLSILFSDLFLNFSACLLASFVETVGITVQLHLLEEGKKSKEIELQQDL